MIASRPWMRPLAVSSLARRLLFFLFLLAAWAALVRLGWLPEVVFPSPLQVAQALAKGAENGTLPLGVVVSLKRILIGFAISAVLGVGLGSMMGRIPLLDETLGSLALGMQALPSICWLPLAALWFGLNETAILFVVVMGSLLSITLATEAGIKNTPPRYLQAARNLGAQGWRLYATVILPAALPSIVAGMKVGWTFAWRSLMSAELLYMSLGLGQLLMIGRETKDMSLVVSVMLVIVTIGLAVDRLVFAPIESRVLEQWGAPA